MKQKTSKSSANRETALLQQLKACLIAKGRIFYIKTSLHERYELRLHCEDQQQFRRCFDARVDCSRRYPSLIWGKQNTLILLAALKLCASLKTRRVQDNSHGIHGLLIGEPRRTKGRV